MECLIFIEVKFGHLLQMTNWEYQTLFIYNFYKEEAKGGFHKR